MKKKYYELATAKVSDTRNIVISETDNNGITMAQQLVVNESAEKNKGHKTTVFLKGAIHIKSVKELIGLRDAIGTAIAILSAIEETEDEDSGEWD